ncbi:MULTISPECIES: nicotinate (nicotinamide) nucleotide adenylyltransferase [unclassified Flavobacterium]|jgi:nicotinate-nucleotide adenylyltransferase|uniref:nicotinate (nicotinamide) nucleotide adenylyltransferase n=1 Tax=unclassified Flavobacterium TaxID=196869 RepID=UPI00057D10E5|nr:MULTISPECIES: nicotinate (nicotinamide) nucleotide adenylyltransferase [unclassified Flavobacterium]KIA98253.1 nicotinate-nucleotide adenylyltransferase [Flavobacterium sp. KMS]MEA9415193.1 nicotinate (nicotinamide) nucleotide adenylyltransferase [Flavobacterium sp. PL02]OUL62163.1 nicotinate-nicotinamide nucleotide adenylyltransferase [Flavobacterium sp. AJR]
MKIGLYFGTFNPIHVGHLIIANHMAEHADLDQVWMVVTPHNPLKKKDTLLDDYHRLQMVHLATDSFDKLKPSDIEFKLSQPNYTVNTLVHLQERYPNHEFSLIMGEDNLKTLHKWKNYEVILQDYDIYVYPRISSEVENLELKNHPKIHLIDAPIVEISSTFIRNNIKEGKNIQPLLPEKVWEYIDHNNFYKK